MKANELVVGKKYWCGWASRSVWFVRFETQFKNVPEYGILKTKFNFFRYLGSGIFSRN